MSLWPWGRRQRSDPTDVRIEGGRVVQGGNEHGQAPPPPPQSTHVVINLVTGSKTLRLSTNALDRPDVEKLINEALAADEHWLLVDGGRFLNFRINLRSPDIAAIWVVRERDDPPT